PEVLFDLRDRPAPGQHGGDRGVSERELNRRRLEAGAGPIADGLQLLSRPHEGRRGRGVVEGRARSRVGQDAAVEHAASDDGDPALCAQRQQLGGAGTVEERVAAGEEEAVEVGIERKTNQHLGLYYVSIHGTDPTFVAYPDMI